ncbi:MAG TPA: hypothetical protein VG013_30065 [Gemmataceae bacterium]|nr:hypothetical protein [Gemmataceae bacterium]
MASPDLSPLHRQIGRVSRRLFLQTFLNRLVWCCSAALLLSAAWFLAQWYLFDSLSVGVRLAVAGGAVLAGVALAGVLAMFQAPSRVAAALLMDERFGLKERVTTSLTLAPGQEATPAGQALLEDVNQRVGQLDVGSRFPMRVSWTAALVPVCAAVLAVAAFYYQPAPAQATLGSGAGKDREQAPANADEIKEKLNRLKQQAARRKPTDPAVSEDLKRIEAELDKIANKPHDTKNELRERVKELTPLEDELKNREQKLADKNEAVKHQLDQLNRGPKDGSQDGPAKELHKALSQGNMDQARKEMENLEKKLKNDGLSKKEQEQLAKQMKDIEQKLQQLSRQEDKEKQLKKLNQDGKLDAETLQRELDQLKQDKDKLKDLANVAKQLGQCQKCLKQGDSAGAAKSLKQATEQLKEMSGQDKELREVREQLQRLQDARESCCKGMGDQPGGENMNAKNTSKNPGGRRTAAPDKGNTRGIDREAKVMFDKKGQKVFEGYAPGEGFKGKSAAEIAGDVKQASQEAPEAMDQQRIPKAARDMARGYFGKLGGQKANGQKK